jgi:hypothetical protein
MLWAAPIQMAICLALLISKLGPSALAGRVFRLLYSYPGNLLGKITGYPIRRKTMVWKETGNDSNEVMLASYPFHAMWKP